MAEPARVHKLHNPELMDPKKAELLLNRLEALTEEKESLMDALKSERKKRQRAVRELQDLLAEYADGDEVTKFICWQRDYQKRSARTDTSPNTERAKAYRKLRKKWSTREIAIMVVGITSDPWRSKNGLTDLQDILERADWWFQKGVEIRGGRT